MCCDHHFIKGLINSQGSETAKYKPIDHGIGPKLIVGGYMSSHLGALFTLYEYMTHIIIKYGPTKYELIFPFF